MASKAGLQRSASGSNFLTPTRPDDDASSIRSVSEQDSDSADDEVLQGARTSREIADHDRSVLEEEEEREKLLAGGAAENGLRRIFSGGLNASRVTIGKKERRRRRRNEKAERRRSKKDRLMAQHGEDGELMYEMEEGGLKSDASSISSDASSEIDRRKIGDVFGRQSQPSRRLKFSLIHASIVVLFLILLLAAYQASTQMRSKNKSSLKILSNGTSSFAPTTILVSLDGFRADFLNRGLTPTLNAFIADGISPKYMLPSFPSVTFPNHYTLVTGLYPESHGIVGNTFWDPELKEEFYYTDKSRSMQPKWWGGEPLWVTAESQGIKTAIHMWPGSEAHIAGVEPSFLDKYNGSEVLSKKIDRVLGLLDLPAESDAGPERPQFIAYYVPVVDGDGHKYGPNSTEIRATIKNVDNMLADLLHGIEQRNLTDIVNIVVVSDHGMATTSTDRLIQLDDLIDVNLIEHMDGWPLYGLRPKRDSDLPALHEQLAREAAKNPNIEVYLRDKDMPERYHFSKNERIAPLWIMPRTGWAIVTKEQFDVEQAKKDGTEYHPKGLHGYDHEHPLMRAIFVAKGPAFPHKPNSRVDVFQNIEVYNIVCDTLALTPKPNNGTLRLPLKPVGLHSDPSPSPPPSSNPVDFISDPDASPPPSPSPSSSAATANSTAPDLSVDTPDLLPARPEVEDDSSTDADEGGEKGHKFWEFFQGKYKGLKAWLEDVVTHLKGEKTDGELKEEAAGTGHPG